MLRLFNSIIQVPVTGMASSNSFPTWEIAVAMSSFAQRAALACGAVVAGVHLARTQADATQGGSADEFYDSHFHLTNYIQEGIDVRQFLKIMGTRVGRSTLFGIPLQQQWSYANSGEFAPTYYLHSDAPLYYYSFTDAYIASVYRSLSKEEQARLEALKRQQEKERAEQLAKEQDEALRKIAQAEAQARLVDEYKRRIADRIKRFIVEPPGLQGNPEVEFFVVVLPGGEVLDVKTRRPSGQATWDAAVERAIRRAQPLPLPPVESGLMREFRELNLKFRPKE